MVSRQHGLLLSVTQTYESLVTARLVQGRWDPMRLLGLTLRTGYQLGDPSLGGKEARVTYLIFFFAICFVCTNTSQRAE